MPRWRSFVNLPPSTFLLRPRSAIAAPAAICAKIVRWSDLVALVADHAGGGLDRHMYATAAPSSPPLSLSSSVPSLSSYPPSSSPHRPFYDFGSVVVRSFLPSVSSERDHKSRLSEGGREAEAAGMGHICQTGRARLNAAKANHFQRCAVFTPPSGRR